MIRNPYLEEAEDDERDEVAEEIMAMKTSRVCGLVLVGAFVAAAGATRAQGQAAQGWASVQSRVLTVYTERGTAQWNVPCYANSLGMEFSAIPPGEFLMGDSLAPEDAARRWPGANAGWFAAGRPQHKMRITKAFYLGRFEVTRGQFAVFVRETNYQTDAEKAGKAYGYTAKDNQWGQWPGITWRTPGFEQTDAHPVVCVSWNDAMAFCTWLSRKEGQPYALPTEAQWEYACRAGSTGNWPWGNREEDAQGKANIAGEGEAMNWTDPFRGVRDGFSYTAPVGSFLPNAFGLHDMIGNAAEWCADWDAPYDASPQDDPAGPAQGTRRSNRGGGWGSATYVCRSAHRSADPPESAFVTFGFRVLRPFPQ